MRRSWWLALLIVGVLGLLAAAFLWLDFRVLQGEMTADSQVETYGFSIDEEARLPQRLPLDLYVEAPPWLEEELAMKLIDELSTSTYAGDVRRQNGALTPAPQAVLVVRLGDTAEMLWTPVFARLDATVRVAYASDGAVAWIDETPVVLESDETQDPVVRVRATQEFADNAYGLISRPGYAGYVAGEMAAQISESLGNALAPSIAYERQPSIDEP